MGLVVVAAIVGAVVLAAIVRAVVLAALRLRDARRVMRALRQVGDAQAQLDAVDHEDVRPVAQYLHAMCGRPQHRRSDFAYAAKVWLVFGVLRLPPGARPLDKMYRDGLPRPLRERV